MKNAKIDFNREKYILILRCSICTGETILGFKNIETNEFIEISLIKNKKELDYFKKIYSIEDIKKEY